MVFDAVARHKGGVLSMDSFKQVIDMERAASKAGQRIPKPYQAALTRCALMPGLPHA